MPITIRTESGYIRNSDGTYSAFNSIGQKPVADQLAEIAAEGTKQKGSVTTAGATQISAVNTAGNAAISAITEKAATFTDYTETQEKIQGLKEDTTALNETVFYTEPKELTWFEGLVANANKIRTSTKDKVSAPIMLYAGETVTIKTKGDGTYWFNAVSSVSSLNIIPANNVPCVNLLSINKNTLTEYTYTATEDTPIVISVYAGDDTSSVTFSGISKASRIDDIAESVKKLETRNTGVLQGKNVMIFGDSLAAASSGSIYGFAHIIADRYGMPYEAFVHDSKDGNTQDVPKDYVRFVNYAKDGTTNMVMSSRTDSVIERVKRHIDANTDVDYVLVECCVNDAYSEYRNKGQVSSGYTSFDETTSIGAIEETIRYITTLGKPIRLGFFIPWKISWVDPLFFDEYIAVFEKWGIPLLDLRTKAGFDFWDATGHRNLYSLSTSNYESYDSTKTYELDALVKYQGVNYKCLADGTVGIPPTDTSKWMSIGSGSNDGTHLNSIGHQIVAGKIQSFIESL